MIQKNNNFRFSVYNKDSLIIERIFTADVFNPSIRVDIRENIPHFIQKLQDVLSGDYYPNDEYGKYLNWYKKELKKYNISVESNLKNTNRFSKQFGESSDCKFVLYINDNTIVERDFYVNNYNPEKRFSFELKDLIDEICETAFQSLKRDDMNYIWDDNDLMNIYGLYINQIRELSPEKRKEYIRRKNDPNFVRSIKKQNRGEQTISN